MIKLYDILLTLLTPFIFITGKIGLPHRKITGEHYFKYRDSINVGDIFLTKTNWELSNITNPCELKHGAVYVGNVYGDEIKYVLESTADGVILTNLVDFLLSKDVVIITELKAVLKREVTKEQIHKIALKLKGTPYDYLFRPEGKSLYCFETCVVFLSTIFPELNLRPREIMGSKKIYDHTTLLDPEFFNVKVDSRKDNF